MSEFKPGDRVHVEFDAEVSNVYKHVLTVMAGGRRDDWGPAVPFGVPDEWCSLLSPPFHVGDLTDQYGPEPPLGTVIRTIAGTVFERTGDVWSSTGNAQFRWASGGPSQARILYVPDMT